MPITEPVTITLFMPQGPKSYPTVASWSFSDGMLTFTVSPGKTISTNLPFTIE